MRKYKYRNRKPRPTQAEQPTSKALTLVLYSEAMTDEEFKNFDPEQLKARLRKQLERCGFTNPVIGGLEFDYHEDIDLWIPHFHLQVLDDNKALVYLRNKYYSKGTRPKTPDGTRSRAMLVQKLKDRPKQLSYLSKQRPQSIRSYQQDGKRKTRKVRLEKNRHCLALQVLDRVGFSNLLFFYKARVINNSIRINPVSEEK